MVRQAVADSLEHVRTAVVGASDDAGYRAPGFAADGTSLLMTNLTCRHSEGITCGGSEQQLRGILVRTGSERCTHLVVELG